MQTVRRQAASPSDASSQEAPAARGLEAQGAAGRDDRGDLGPGHGRAWMALPFPF